MFTHIVPDEKKLLTLPNGVRISFGDIIAMAGDFYGIPEAPIIDPLSPDQVDDGARQRFKNAYNTLAVTPNEGKYKVCSNVKFRTASLCLLIVPLNAKFEGTDAVNAEYVYDHDRLI